MTMRCAAMAMAVAMAAVSGMAVHGQTTPATGAANEALVWPVPTAENRLWTRWWWMGNAVDEKNITGQLEMFHAAGLGGVEICPIYGVYGAENRYVDFLSPKWMGLLGHTVRETRRLGMLTDMTTGTGWPFGGNMVADAEASKGIVLKSFDRLPEVKALPAGKVVCAMAYPPNTGPADITEGLVSGANFLPFPTGTRFVVGVQTGPQQQVKRPAPGAEGNVLDPYSTEALNKYLAVFDKSFAGAAMEKDMPRGQFHDSFEYYQANWTGNLFDEFKKRRGYDLRTQFAAFNNEGPADIVARVKCDYRETLSDLHLEYMNRWVAWSHSHGGIGRNQAHGGPGNILDVYANADVPECEIFHLFDETQLPFLKLASSAAHVTGKRLSSSESFTWLDEHFAASLAEVKPAADFLLLAGVNHMFLHGIPYSPEDAAWPGWNFYASVNFGPYGGLWRDFPAFAAYVARCQSILQANKPSNDVLLYAPWYQFWSDPANNDKLMIQFTTHGTWMDAYPFYTTSNDLWSKGYGYDEVSDRLLQNAKATDAGGIDMGGNQYRVVLIPKTPLLPVETIRKLLDLARGGATVAFIGGLPADVPGLGDLEKRRAALKELRSGLLFETDADGISSAVVGKGMILAGIDLKALEARWKGKVVRESMVDSGLRFIRRQRPDGFDYFVVNRSEKMVNAVPLAVHAKTAFILDPRFDKRSGTAVITPGNPTDPGDTIALRVAPGESYFIRTVTNRVVPGPAWEDLVPGAPVPLTGTWNVSFVEGGPVTPKSFTVKAEASGKLASWTAAAPDPEAQRFAGTAKYTLEFEFPLSSTRPANAETVLQFLITPNYRLDLGKVGDSARVTFNGQSLGTLWAAPFAIDLGTALKPGRNTLEIEVTNVAANRVRDMDQRGVQWKIFRDANVLSTAYTKFDASSWPLRDAGLLGPVQLVPLVKAAP